jgi:hypothetical protein
MRAMRAILVLLLAVMALPMQISHAARWGGVQNRFLSFGFLDLNTVCRDGATIAAIRTNDDINATPTLPMTDTYEVRLAPGTPDPLLVSTVITVTALPRPALELDLDEDGITDTKPYTLYSTRKVLWDRSLDAGTVVRLSFVFLTGFSSTDPVPVSDCSTGERNRTIEQRNALTGLLPTGDKKSDRHIQNAVDALNRSLAPELWQADGLRLTEHGNVVFNEFSKAVRQLAKVERPIEAIAHAITTLPDVASGLARTAIEDAVVAQGDAGAITKAETAFAKGLTQLNAGDAAGAIRQFRRAWLHAQQAANHWSVEINETTEELATPDE